MVKFNIKIIVLCKLTLLFFLLSSCTSSEHTEITPEVKKIMDSCTKHCRNEILGGERGSPDIRIGFGDMFHGCLSVCFRDNKFSKHLETTLAMEVVEFEFGEHKTSNK